MNTEEFAKEECVLVKYLTSHWIFEPRLWILPDKTGWMDLSHIGTILGLGDDEAILAKSFRDYCKSRGSEKIPLELDEFGKCIRRASTEELNQECILYLETSVKCNQTKLLQELVHFGTIQDIVLPRQLQGTSQSTFAKSFGFVIFETVSATNACLSAYPALAPLKTSSILPAEIQGWQASRRESTSIVYRVLTYHEWNTRTLEYIRLLQKENQELEDILKNQQGSHGHLQHDVKTSRTVAFFSGVHPGSSRKTIKKLFEWVAPVSYVDWQSGQKTGYIRFKSAHGAHLAHVYFHREYIVQLNPEDTGTLWNKQAQLSWTDSDARKETEKQRIQCIELRILEEKEENEYWESVIPQLVNDRSDETNGQGNAVIAGADHTVPEDGLGDSKKKKKKKKKPKAIHIKFGEENEMDEERDEDTNNLANTNETHEEELFEEEKSKKRHREKEAALEDDSDGPRESKKIKF